MREIAVDRRQLALDTDRMQETVTALRKEMQALRQDMEELNAMWTGPANAIFRMQFEADQEMLEGICKTVDALIDCCIYADREYNDCANEVYEIVASIQI